MCRCSHHIKHQFDRRTELKLLNNLHNNHHIEVDEAGPGHMEIHMLCIQEKHTWDYKSKLGNLKGKQYMSPKDKTHPYNSYTYLLQYIQDNYH